MSKADSGIEGVVAAAIAASKAALGGDSGAAEQLSLIDAPTPEDVLEAREALGAKASAREVVAEARRRKVGRPAGSQNKRTDDFARYILSFGQDPAITLMKIQATPPEVLIEASRRVRRRHRTKNGIEVDVMQTMSYEAAVGLIKQCAAELLPFIHAKRPQAVDMTVTGVRIIEEVGGHGPAATIDGEFLRVAGPDDIEGEPS